MSCHERNCDPVKQCFGLHVQLNDGLLDRLREIYIMKMDR